MAYTQHRPFAALAGRRYGSFAGKTVDTGGAHPVSVLTQHRPLSALAGKRYGSFAGKSGGAPSEQAPPFPHSIPLAWSADPGWTALYAFHAYGSAVANRDEVLFAATGAVTHLRLRATAGTLPIRSTGAVGRLRLRAAVSAADASTRTTGAVTHLRLRALAGTSPAFKSTGSTTYIAVRALTGLLTSNTVEPEQFLANLRSLLPRQQQRLVNADGTMASEWYRFFDYWINTVLGGPDAPSMGDVVAEIERQIAAASALEARLTAQTQKSQANAESLSAAIQVIQNNSLTGASQIPPAQTTTEEP